MDSEKKLFEEIWREHKKLLGDTTINNPKRIICIAGVPGSGKTTLLRELNKELKGIFFRVDDVRDILTKVINRREFWHDSDFQTRYFQYVTGKYLLKYPNKTIILDRSVDRAYEVIFELADKYSLQKVIISLNCNKEIIEERIADREGRYKDAFLKRLDKWIEDHNRFNELGIADIYLQSGKETEKEMVRKICTLIRE